jgi:hypothetical protein
VFIADSSPSATVGDESNPRESGGKGTPVSGRRAAIAIDLGSDKTSYTKS